MALLTCHLCQRTFPVVNELISHYRRKHAKCTIFGCVACNRKYTNLESFRYHLNKHIANGTSRHQNSSQNLETQTIETQSLGFQSQPIEIQCLKYIELYIFLKKYLFSKKDNNLIL